MPIQYPENSPAFIQNIKGDNNTSIQNTGSFNLTRVESSTGSTKSERGGKSSESASLPPGLIVESELRGLECLGQYDLLSQEECLYGQKHSILPEIPPYCLKKYGNGGPESRWIIKNSDGEEVCRSKCLIDVSIPDTGWEYWDSQLERWELEPRMTVKDGFLTPHRSLTLSPTVMANPVLYHFSDILGGYQWQNYWSMGRPIYVKNRGDRVIYLSILRGKHQGCWVLDSQTLAQPFLITSVKTSLSPASITKWTSWDVTGKDLSEMFVFPLRISTDDAHVGNDIIQQYVGDRGISIQASNTTSPQISVVSYGENTGMLEKMMEKENEIHCLEIEILKQNQELEKAKEKNTRLEKKKQRLKEDIKKKLQELEQTKKMVEYLKHKLGNTEQSNNFELWRAREKEQELLRDLEKLKNDKHTAQIEIKEQKEKIRKIERKKKVHRQKIQDLEKEIELQKQTRAKLIMAIETVAIQERTIEKIIREKEAAENEIKEGQKTIRRMEEQNEERKREIERLKAEITMFEKEEKEQKEEQKRETENVEKVVRVEKTEIEDNDSTGLEIENREEKTEIESVLENFEEIEIEKNQRSNVRKFTEKLLSASKKKIITIGAFLIIAIVAAAVLPNVLPNDPKTTTSTSATTSTSITTSISTTNSTATATTIVTSTKTSTRITTKPSTTTRITTTTTTTNNSFLSQQTQIP